MSLHNDIMNLPTGPEMPDTNPGRGIYKAGHRDARHAAAELVAERESVERDLVNALEQSLTSMLDSGYSNNSVVVRAARQALAKATGGG